MCVAGCQGRLSMRHNCHIFEPEALLPSVAESRRYVPLRPRSAVLVQSVGATGKSTLCNLIASNAPAFPYLLQVPPERKPSVALSTDSILLDTATKVPPSHGGLLNATLFESARAPFSRSFSDGMFLRSASCSPREAPSSARTAQDAPPASCLPCKHVRFTLTDSAVPSLMQPWVEKALTPHLVPAVERNADETEIAFVTLQFCNNDNKSVEERRATHPLTLIESRAPDDRPAMHLTHTVVFLLSEDDAIFAARRRSHHQSSSPSLKLDSESSYKCANRDAALVAHMSAVTTCDGDLCRCCLVVNMGKRMRASACEGAAPPTNPGDDFVDIEHDGSQHPNGDDTRWLNDQRDEIGRRWRVASERVFLFSALRMIAERLVNPSLPATPGEADVPAAMHLASRFERDEFFRFLAFVRDNSSRACDEWQNREVRRIEKQLAVAAAPHCSNDRQSITRGTMKDPTTESSIELAAPPEEVEQSRGGISVLPSQAAEINVPTAPLAPTAAEVQFMNEKLHRMREESVMLATRIDSQQERVRSAMAALQAEQASAAQRAARRQ